MEIWPRYKILIQLEAKFVNSRYLGESGVTPWSNFDILYVSLYPAHLTNSDINAGEGRILYGANAISVGTFSRFLT